MTKDLKWIKDVYRGTTVLDNILIEFGITMKLVRLIKMCLNETYSKVRIGNVVVRSMNYVLIISN
jgi:uncharacterized membrane protein